MEHRCAGGDDGYRTLFEAASDGMLLAGEDRCVLDANPSACRLLERARDDLVGTLLDDLFDPSYPVLEAAWEKVRGEGGFYVSARLLLGDGSSFPAGVTVSGGEGRLGVVFRKAAGSDSGSEPEQATAAGYRAMVEGAMDAMVVCNLDNTFRYVNPAFVRLMGYEPGELVGRFVPDTIHPEDLARAASLNAEIHNAHEPSGPYEVRYRRRDGSWVSLETTLNNLADDPEVRGVVAVCRDVTERAEAERRLRESEERFRALMENAQDFVVLADENNVALYASPAVERVLGYTPKEFVGTVIAGYVHPDDLERTLEKVAETLPIPGPHHLGTIKYRRRDGSDVHLEVVANNRLDDPVLRGVVCNCRDVTERVEAEQKLREAEERYRLLVEQVPAVTYVERNDVDSSTVYVSPQIEALLGYTPEEWISDAGLWLRTLHPEDHGRVLARHLRCNETGEPFDEEYRCFAKDGREVWLRDDAMLVRGAYGEPLYWQGVKADITGRKRAELEILRLNGELRGQVAGYTAELKAAIEGLKEGERHLREREEQFHATFERAAVGIAHVSPEGRFLRTNGKMCEILGYGREELAKKSFQEITHPEDLDADLEHVRRLLSGEIGEYTVEKRYLRKDGSAVWANLSVSLVRQAAGMPDRFFVAVVEDITKRKGAEELLKVLSPREVEILGHVAKGRTNAEIASELAFSPSTVKAHVGSITQKLGVTDRTAAAAHAVEMGLFTPRFKIPGGYPRDAS